MFITKLEELWETINLALVVLLKAAPRKKQAAAKPKQRPLKMGHVAKENRRKRKVDAVMIKVLKKKNLVVVGLQARANLLAARRVSAPLVSSSGVAFSL